MSVGQSDISLEYAIGILYKDQVLFCRRNAWQRLEASDHLQNDRTEFHVEHRRLNHKHLKYLTHLNAIINLKTNEVEEAK